MSGILNLFRTEDAEDITDKSSDSIALPGGPGEKSGALLGVLGDKIRGLLSYTIGVEGTEAISIHLDTKLRSK